MDQPCSEEIVSAFEVLGCPLSNPSITKREWFLHRRNLTMELEWLDIIRTCIREEEHDEFHRLHTAAATLFDWAEDYFYREQLFLLYLCHFTLTEPETAWENHDRDFGIRGIKKKSLHRWTTKILTNG